MVDQARTQVFRKEGEVILRHITGVSLLIPIRGGDLARMQKVFVLNPVAECIWGQLDGKNDLAAIAERVASRFDVSSEQAAADVGEFIRELLREQLVAEVGER